MQLSWVLLDAELPPELVAILMRLNPLVLELGMHAVLDVTVGAHDLPARHPWECDGAPPWICGGHSDCHSTIFI